MSAQIGMLGVIVSAIMVIMIGYLMVGISGYLAFPTTVEGNVLNSFTRGDVIMQVTPISLITMQLSIWPCIGSPPSVLSMYPTAAAMQHMGHSHSRRVKTPATAWH